MRNILNNNKGSTMIEAVIYFPIILILVIGMVVVAMFKLDKMMTQACMSQRVTEIQSLQDNPDKSERPAYWSQQQIALSLEYYTQNSIFKWENPTEKQYIYRNYGVACPILHFDYKVSNCRSFLGLIRSNTTHSAIVLNNPIDIVYTMHDVQTLCTMTSLGTVIEGKTGYTYEEYLVEQFGR